jgi:uncharacterized protein YbjT (DUF2867 family)
MIVVIGGRSKIGKAPIEELASKEQHARGLIRSGEAGDISAGGRTVIGDLADTGLLRAVLNGVAKVLLLCGPTAEEVQLNKNAIDAAESARVTLLVRSSIFGSDPSSEATFVPDHVLCDEYLRDSDVQHVIVRPNLFLAERR